MKLDLETLNLYVTQLKMLLKSSNERKVLILCGWIFYCKLNS